MDCRSIIFLFSIYFMQLSIAGEMNEKPIPFDIDSSALHVGMRNDLKSYSFGFPKPETFMLSRPTQDSDYPTMEEILGEPCPKAVINAITKINRIEVSLFVYGDSFGTLWRKWGNWVGQPSDLQICLFRKREANEDQLGTHARLRQIVFAKGRIYVVGHIYHSENASSLVAWLLDDTIGLEAEVNRLLAKEAPPAADPSLTICERRLLEYHAWSQFPKYWEQPDNVRKMVENQVEELVRSFEKKLVSEASNQDPNGLYTVYEIDSMEPKNNRMKRDSHKLEQMWHKFLIEWQEQHPLPKLVELEHKNEKLEKFIDNVKSQEKGWEEFRTRAEGKVLK